MIRNVIARRCAGAIMAACLITVPAFAAATACDTPGVLRVSTIPEGRSQQDARAFQPILERLQAKTGIRAEFVARSSYSAVIEGLGAGTIDVARLGPSSYVAAQESGAAITAFATYAVRSGAFQSAGPYYQSMLVVLAKSGIEGIKDLRGRVLSLVDPESTSGALIPKKLFSTQIGMPLDQYFGRVGYAGSHDNAIDSLLAGRTDAAFVSSLHLSTSVRTGRSREEDFKVLWKSKMIPMDPFVSRNDLCPALQERIKAAFLDNRPTDIATLNGIEGTEFLPISEDSFALIRELRRQRM